MKKKNMVGKKREIQSVLAIAASLLLSGAAQAEKRLIHSETIQGQLDLNKVDCRYFPEGDFQPEEIRIYFPNEAFRFDDHPTNEHLPTNGGQSSFELMTKGKDCSIMTDFWSQSGKGKLKVHGSRSVYEYASVFGAVEKKCVRWINSVTKIDLNPGFSVTDSRILHLQTVDNPESCQLSAPLKTEGHLFAHLRAASDRGIHCQKDKSTTPANFRLRFLSNKGSLSLPMEMKSQKAWSDVAVCEAKRDAILNQSREDDPSNHGQILPATRSWDEETRKSKIWDPEKEDYVRYQSLRHRVKLNIYGEAFLGEQFIDIKSL